jgi:hypothetical protein
MKESLFYLSIILILTTIQAYVVFSKYRDGEYENFRNNSFSEKGYFLKSVFILIFCLFLTIYALIKLIQKL